jgi:hypothetical protein
MDEIYNEAIQVNVHLGSGDERTEVAIEAVKTLGIASLLALQEKELRATEWTMRNEYEKVAEEVLRKSCYPYLLGGTEEPISISVPNTLAISFATVSLLTLTRNFSRLPIWQTVPFVSLTVVS